MAKLFIIVGMAGSGKTYAANELARNEKIRNVFPDATNVDCCDKKRAGINSLGEIVARLKRGENCVMDEAHLTNDEFRKHFITFCNTFLGEIDISWIVFELNKLNCINNLKHDFDHHNRKDKGRLESFKNQAENYSSDSVKKELESMGFQVETRAVTSSNVFFNDLEKAMKWLDDAIKQEPIMS